MVKVSSARDAHQPTNSHQVITFLTSDGIVRLPGRVLQHNTTKLTQLRVKLQQLPQPTEQGLCIGNVFTVAAMNACDPGRRVNLQGFCRSVDLVSEAVEDVVVRAGGEVITTQCNLKQCVITRVGCRCVVVGDACAHTPSTVPHQWPAREPADDGCDTIPFWRTALVPSLELCH